MQNLYVMINKYLEKLRQKFAWELALFIYCDVISFSLSWNDTASLVNSHRAEEWWTKTASSRYRRPPRRVLSRGTRRRRRSERARSRRRAACVASSLAAARNRCIYVGDSCQRYLACAFLRLKDPKDGVNDILAVRANDRPARRTDAPQRTTAGTLRAHLNWITLAKWASIQVGISTIPFLRGRRRKK